MRFSKLLAIGIVLLAAGATLAQTPSYTNVGRTPTKEEIQAWDIAAGPDGKGLPPGQGTAKEGAPIFAAKCAVCHGEAAAGAKIGPRLTGGQAEIETFTTLRPVRTLGSYWPYATTVWDYINRAMPRNQGGTLSANEVYALTAFVRDLRIFRTKRSADASRAFALELMQSCGKPCAQEDKIEASSSR